MHGTIAWFHHASYAGLGIVGKMLEAKLSSGLKSFAVAKDEAILTAALRAGVNLSHICRRGTCGACRASVVQGEVRQDLFRPTALSCRDGEAGYVLLCCSRALSNVVIDAIELDHPPELARRIPARVVSLDRRTSEVAVLTLRVPSIEPFDYVPGQYVGIVGEDGFARAFSIANAPRSDRSIELHIGRVQNGVVTNYVHEHLNVGDVIQIETAQGSNRLPADESRPLIAIVGGTGYAPIQAILEDWIARGVRKENSLVLGKSASIRFLRDTNCRAADFVLPEVDICSDRVERESRRPLAGPSWIGAFGCALRLSRPEKRRGVRLWSTRAGGRRRARLPHERIERR